jgi:hypothetical protein
MVSRRTNQNIALLRSAGQLEKHRTVNISLLWSENSYWCCTSKLNSPKNKSPWGFEQKPSERSLVILIVHGLNTTTRHRQANA